MITRPRHGVQRRRRSPSVLVSLVAALSAILAALSPAAYASQSWTDGFESGDTSLWDTVHAGGDGSLAVQQEHVADGGHALRLAASSTSGSRAFVRRSFSPTTDVTASVGVLVLDEGPAGGNVPLVRLFYDGTRVVSIHRQNADGDRIWAQHSGGFHATTGRLPLGEWADITVHVSAPGSVQVELDDTVIYETTSASLGAAGIDAAQLGQEISRQHFDLVADNVGVAFASAASEPEPSGDGCDSTMAPPSNDDPGEVVVADGFESDDFSQWTRTASEGDGVASIQRDVVWSGRCAAHLHVTTDVWSSRANLSKTLPEHTSEVWAEGRFTIQTEGASGWNTPTFRVFSNGQRLMDVSRQNETGSLFVRYPNGSKWTIASTGRSLSMQRWYDVRLHVAAAGNLSTIEVWLDGSRVFRTTEATLGVGTLEAVMVGAEHRKQAGDLAIDDVIVKAVTSPPTPEVFADGFESASLGAWTTVRTAGDATAHAQDSFVRTGAFTAELQAAADGKSYAYLRQPLAAAERDLTANVSIRAETEGASPGSVPLLSMYDAGGRRLVNVIRHNGSGKLSIEHSGDTHPTSGTLALREWGDLRVRTLASGDGAGTVEVGLDDVDIYRATTADLGAHGVKSVQVGADGPGKGYELLIDDVVTTRGAAGPADDPRHKLLIADYLGRRLVITDFDGNVVWQYQNPTDSDSWAAGPLGVRWLPNNRILVAFGTGVVGVIDVATTSWVWQVKGFNGDWFRSPYDAELLPDGRVAVALRYNSNGRVSVYDVESGAEVWRHYLSNAHSVKYHSPEQSYGTDKPTLLIGGWGYAREVTYEPGKPQTVTWQVDHPYTHDAIAVDDDHVLAIRGHSFSMFDRAGSLLWKRAAPDGNRRVAVNPNFGGGYVFTVGDGDRIEFRDDAGHVLRSWSRLSDGTNLYSPYGIQVINYDG